MSERLQRQEALQPITELSSTLVEKMGEHPEQRLDWLMQQTGESFGNILLQINSTARGLGTKTHNFDGHSVQAGTIGGSIPPDQEDKIALLDVLISTAQQHIGTQTEKGEDPQTIVSELAVALPTVINKLHLFADGNGRTSRIMRMVLRDGDQITPNKVEALVCKKGIEKYDTTPSSPVENSVMTYMRSINGAGELKVSDDVVDEDTFADEVDGDILRAFPTIDPRVIKANSDSANFSETVRLIGKDAGATENVSLRELFDKVTKDPNELAKFTTTYRAVRKQRAELLITGLLGVETIPLTTKDKDQDASQWFNTLRQRNGLAPIDSSKIKTVQDFQMAYSETHSPQRTAA